jgi:Zn-dependent oligopeptidase
MDEQQQRRVNAAAEEYANAIVKSQRAMAERGVSAQEMNAQLTQQFFNSVIDNLQRMAAETRGASQELAEQTQRAKQAAQALTQETAGAYMEYITLCSLCPRRACRWPRGEQRKPQGLPKSNEPQPFGAGVLAL